ncbi:MAG: hypothetical protein WAL56_05010 [Candidatus Sulfotelmatobacter sp.]
MEARTELRAAVSGSFHRHMEAITRAVHELATLSVRVLSPADPRVVAAQGEFLFVASDRVRSVRLVQDRHLESIRAADFLWLVCPDGYVGQSASMEIGYAAGVGIPMFAHRPPSDLTLREYVTAVPSIADAVHRVEASGRPRRNKGVLIDPNASIEEAHNVLERMRSTLNEQHSLVDPAPRFYEHLSKLQALVGAGSTQRQ